MVAGIVLAAGASTRMGRCKATLPVGDTHLLGLALGALKEAGLSPLVVVSGKYHHQIERAASAWLAQVVNNPDWQEGQITSLQSALAWCGSGKPVVVSLVDHPGFSAGLCRKMLEIFEQGSVPGVIPTYQGQTGHPVLFGPEMVEQLRHLGADKTARDVVKQFEDRIHYLATDEEAILYDIDTEDDYEVFLSKWKP